MSADAPSRSQSQAVRRRPTLVLAPARTMPFALRRRISEVRKTALGAEAPRCSYERWKR